MANPINEPRLPKVVSLDDAIREVKIAAADRGDVVVELREAAKARLELLADALSETIAKVPADDDQFDFAISSGQNPRLFIDATSHVGLGRDRMTYRMVRDTRNGRVIMGESRDIQTIADLVTRHVAERIVERQRMMDGDIEPVKRAPAAAAPDAEAATAKPARDGSDFVLGLVWFLIGAVAGGGLLYLWASGALNAAGA